MKKIFLSLLFSVLGFVCFSQEVDEKVSRIIAENFFLENYGFKKNVTETLVKEYKGHPSLYINNMQDGGWVIVPANRNLNPVVAHSDEGAIALNEGPDVFWDWIEQYEFIVDIAINGKWNKEEKFKKWENLLNENEHRNKLKSYVDNTFLLSTNWRQSNTNDGFCPGYNVLLPDMNCSCGNKPKAGCVAVAIGQIMNYWGYSTGTYSDFDWWDMQDMLYHSNNPNFYNDSRTISYLLKRIGDRVSMDYGCDESDANMSRADYALEQFGYKDNMSRKLKATHTYNQWVNILRTEIQAERPLLYSASSHVFVCDGYRSDNDNFHFNLGWGLMANGWYDFEDLGDIENHEKYGNVIIHSCFVGIQPNVASYVSLSNTVIQTTNNDTWTTNNTYQAKSYIHVAGNNTVVSILDSSSCRFVAGDSIVLKPGFHANAGTSLLCKIFKKNSLKNFSLLELDDSYIDTYGNENIQENFNDNFDVYPNPAKNEITLSLKNLKENELNLLQIFNSKGVQVFQQVMVNSSITINISDFPIGQYFITIKCDSQKYSQTFIKQ